MRMPRTVLVLLAAVLVNANAGDYDEALRIRCGRLVYAGSKSSVCFADSFLKTARKQTNLDVETKLKPVRLDSAQLFDHPFCVFSGEGDFKLNERERENLRRYLKYGGFILSSPGCSDSKFNTAIRKELKITFPDNKLKKIKMSHPIFSTVNKITKLVEKKGKTVYLEGLEINGRLALVYSKEGLNHVAKAEGCCCCGGNEIRNPDKVNVNILTYSVLY